MSTIRECYQRAAEEVQDDRPFSSQKFRTDGKTIFIEKFEGIQEPTLFDLKRRQAVFRTIVEPSLKDLDLTPQRSPAGTHLASSGDPS
jgi:hypothetical protein